MFYTSKSLTSTPRPRHFGPSQLASLMGGERRIAFRLLPLTLSPTRRRQSIPRSEVGPRHFGVALTYVVSVNNSNSQPVFLVCMVCKIKRAKWEVFGFVQAQLCGPAICVEIAWRLRGDCVEIAKTVDRKQIPRSTFISFSCTKDKVCTKYLEAHI